jgi:HEAT repeat protein
MLGLPSRAFCAQQPVFSDFGVTTNEPPAAPSAQKPPDAPKTEKSAAAPATEKPPTAPGTELDQVVAAAASYESGQSLEPLRHLEEAVRQSSSNPAARKEIEAGLIRLLGTNATFEAREFACEQLGIIGSEAALPHLSGMLQDPETAGIACLALTTYPPGRADRILRDGVKFASGTARIQILNTLGDRRDPKAVDVLSEQVYNPNKAIAEAAISALGKIGTPAAWKAIRAVKANPGRSLTGAVDEAMLRCADAMLSDGETKQAKAIYEELLANSENVAARRRALSALLRLDKDGGEKRILEVLAGEDNALKPVAIARIPSVPDTDATERFANEMHHLRPQDQALMIDSLAARNDDAARLELAKSLSLPEPMVRRAAIVALGRIGDPYFASLLARAAGATSDAEESRAVETALISLKGGTETDRRLLAELKNSTPKARVALIGALSNRQGAAANGMLLEEADNSDPSVAKATFRALAKTGGDAEAASVVSKLVSLRDDGVRNEAKSTARQLLAKMNNSSRCSTVVREALSRATIPENRAALLGLLPACGDADALDALKTSTKDSDEQVRTAAVRSLADWPDDSVWDTLAALYLKPDSGACRKAAFDGLVRLLGEQNAHPDPKLIARYRALFSAVRTETEFKLLLGVLSGAADPDALALVLPLLSNTTVHSEAAAAARKIVESIQVDHPDIAADALKRLQGN